jgi:hypothetical protein
MMLLQKENCTDKEHVALFMLTLGRYALNTHNNLTAKAV